MVIGVQQGGTLSPGLKRYYADSSTFLNIQFIPWARSLLHAGGACLYSNNARCHQMPQFAPKNSFSGRPLSPLSIRGGHPLLLPLLHLCSAPGPLAQCCFTIITFWGKPLYIFFFTSYLHQLQKVAVVVKLSGTLQASRELQQILATMNCPCTASPASMWANRLWSCLQSMMVSNEQNQCKSVECSIFHLSKLC